MIKSILKRIIPGVYRRKLRRIQKYLTTIGHGFNLSRLGEIYDTDKVGSHFYTQHYQHHFRKFKFKKIQLLEIGVGGYEKPDFGGHSLRMWKRYFPFGRIFAIDIYDKSPLQENRIKIFQGSQVDKDFLGKVLSETKEFDIIIDDGSHINAHVIETFRILFPKLKDGGIYAIEDTQTAYWKDYGGDSDNLNNPDTMTNFFKSLTDCLNHKEFVKPGYKPTYYDENIVSIHFYHNLIFIHKGANDEESNLVVNNMRG